MAYNDKENHIVTIELEKTAITAMDAVEPVMRRLFSKHHVCSLSSEGSTPVLRVDGIPYDLTLDYQGGKQVAVLTPVK